MDWECSSVVECSPVMCKALSSILSTVVKIKKGQKELVSCRLYILDLRGPLSGNSAPEGVSSTKPCRCHLPMSMDHLGTGLFSLEHET